MNFLRTFTMRFEQKSGEQFEKIFLECGANFINLCFFGQYFRRDKHF